MFKKILIANRGENGRSTAVSAQPHRVARAARTGDFDPMEATHV
jgi:hypothetical protein